MDRHPRAQQGTNSMLDRAKRLTRSSTLLTTASGSFVADEDRQDATVFWPFYWPYDQFDVPSPQTATSDGETQRANALFTPSATPFRHGARRKLWFALAACVCLAVLFPAAIFSLSLSRRADHAQVAPPAAIAGEDKAIASEDNLPAPVGDAASLVARGDTFLGAGDVVSARLYYEQAAKEGDGRAAMFMGLTFDTGFLDRVGAHDLHGDTAQAAAWYRRAHDLGEPEAVRLLASLGSN